MPKTCQKCGDSFPFSSIIDGKLRNFKGRKYCLSCSPFGSNNRSNLEHSSASTHTCTCCKVEKDISDFYLRSSGKPRSYCKQCWSSKAMDRQKNLKQQCVDYKGGKCCRCGYDRCIAALEFHHTDPTQKEFGIAQVKSRSINESIKSELDKCELVCSNCHREIHSKGN